MESKKLERKIRDWASNLCFSLPDGSAPPSNYFASLSATPHRRQLWETLIESIQPRVKVEHMRKQILVAKLQERKKILFNGDTKQTTDKIELWHKQDALESQVKDKRLEVAKLYRNISAKFSDLLFEICKLAEQKKYYEDLSERLLAVKLFLKREDNLLQTLEKMLSNVEEVSVFREQKNESNLKKKFTCITAELTEEEKDVDPHNSTGNRKLIDTLKESCLSGMVETQVWEEVSKGRAALLNRFSLFIDEFNLNARNVLGEKGRKREKRLNFYIRQLKQKTVEKGLQVILNSTEEKYLNSETERLIEGFLTEVSESGTLDETVFRTSDEINESSSENEKMLKNLRNHLNIVGLQRYETFLKEEAKRLEEETTKVGRELELNDVKFEEKKLQLTLKDFEAIVDEINTIESKTNNMEKEIICQHEKLEKALLSLKSEPEEQNKVQAIEGIVGKLKAMAGNEISVFMETPLDAFKTIESPSGRLMFECESLPHCLNGYGGELKQFLSAMLIPPQGEPRGILAEIEKRQKILVEVRRFLGEREQLNQLQKKVQNQMDSIKYDSRFCERNFNESDGILKNKSSRTEELQKGVDFLEKILKNWLEQPYRFMLKDSTNGSV